MGRGFHAFRICANTRRCSFAVDSVRFRVCRSVPEERVGLEFNWCCGVSFESYDYDD